MFFLRVHSVCWQEVSWAGLGSDWTVHLQYICIGHSIFDKEGAKLDRELTGNAGNALDQTVELPYCSGIEVSTCGVCCTCQIPLPTRLR